MSSELGNVKNAGHEVVGVQGFTGEISEAQRRESRKSNETLAELSSLYLATLNDRELQAYHIAVDHLGMSFTMERSNGYKQWKKERDERIRKIREEDAAK